MIRYSHLRNYLQSYLTSLGYDPLPTFNPGPGEDANAVDVSPGRLVLLSKLPGAGLSVEYAFDRPAFQVRVAGKQGDYDDGEKLAEDCDTGLLKVDHSQYLEDVWVTSIVRAGGNPALLLIDDADRYHFTCTYIAEAATGW